MAASIVTCAVHNWNRPASECYRNFRNQWECTVACPTAMVANRLGSTQHQPLTVERVDRLRLEQLRASYLEALSKTRLESSLEATVNPLELCSFHRQWRGMRNLIMTEYQDYVCTPSSRCMVRKRELDILRTTGVRAEVERQMKSFLQAFHRSPAQANLGATAPRTGWGSILFRE